MKGGVAYLAAQMLWINVTHSRSPGWIRSGLARLSEPITTFIKVVHVVVVDTVLSFSLLHQLEPRANYLWILLEYSLPILCLIKGHFELS
jgi:hypothetical protein